MSLALANSSFKRLDIRTVVYATPIFITELPHLVTDVYAVVAVKVMAYTVLVDFCDMLQFKGHAYEQYQLQSPYKSCRT